MPRVLILFISIFVSNLLHAQNLDSLTTVAPNDTLKGLNKHKGTLENITNFFTHEGDNMTVSIYPTFGYEEVTGAEFGVMPVFRFLPKDTTNLPAYYRPTTFVPTISYTTKGQLELEANLVVYTKRGWNIYSIIEYLETPSAYYGQGNNEKDVTASSYTSKNLTAFGEVAKSINDEFFIGMRYDLANIKISDISDIENGPLTPDVIGYNGGFSLGMGPILKYDTRDDILYPSTGNFLQFHALFYPSFLGNDYNFSKYTVDLRKYLPLNEEKSILALQAYGSFTGGDVPFYKMPILASKRDLRGVDHPFKYIDNHAWYTRAEYRQYVWWRISATAFAGVGNNFGPNGNSIFEELKCTYGVGFRFQMVPDDKLNFRADLGFGPGGEHTVYMTILEAF